MGRKIIVTELNRNIPVLLFNGVRELSYNEPWNQTMAFSLFTKISICMTFQGQRHVCDFFPVSAVNENGAMHSFSWADYSNDGARRIVAGKLSFAGRYMANGKISISYNLGSWSELDLSYIYIEKIIGYR